MPYYAGATVVARWSILSVAVVGLLAGSVAGAQSSSDNVEVMVCPDPSQSSFLVREPQSDSITDQPKAIIQGEVQLISQIDFFIDDAYNNTLALGPSDTAFASTISLSPGTHTLKFVASDSCSNTTHTQSLVITYEPAIQPSIGVDVDTRVDGQPAIEMGVASEVVPPKNIIEEILDEVIVTPLISIGRALDIISLPGASGEMKWQNIARSFFFVVGSGLVMLTGYMSMAGGVPSSISGLPFSRRQILYGGAFIGVVILMLVFIL